MLSAEQTQNWDKEKCIGAPSRSADKPRMEHREDQNGMLIYIRAVQGLSHCGYNQSNFIFVELERTHIPHGQLFQQQINP